MASIRIKTNIDQVVSNITSKLQTATNPEYLLRPICFDVIDLMTNRIHKEGKASDEGLIGTYKLSYLKLRERKYNRSSDPKIIVSLTRQLENDWAVIATPKGYGVGFNNPFNLQKARWVEEQKKKKIFSLAASESTHVRELASELINQALK